MTEEQGGLGLKLVANMEQITNNRIGSLGLNNAKLNAPFLDRGRSIGALRNQSIGKGDQAIVIAAGPSIKIKDPANIIIETGFQGAIIATDSALFYCLRNRIVPDLVVTLDPHATRIMRWFGDPHLNHEKLKHDDYFRRQDMDQSFVDELKVNKEILDLLNRYGKDIRLALSTSASQSVVQRALETGMDIYWWNPMYDDPDLSGSITRKLHLENNLPCINAGGNVGSACWMIATAVMSKKEIALTGMDFSYYKDTPYKNTQYYNEALSLVGKDRLESIFMNIHNPYTNHTHYTDPAYMWYRESFLEMAKEADCKTYNCTEGGILFGDNIHFIPLTDFIRKYR